MLCEFALSYSPLLGDIGLSGREDLPDQRRADGPYNITALRCRFAEPQGESGT